MSALGILLIVLALPLFIGYAISNKKNPMWRNLGFLLGAVGLIIIVLGTLTRM